MLEINNNFEEFFRPSFSSYTGKFRYLMSEQKSLLILGNTKLTSNEGHRYIS